ncbi:hypothetical protein [Sinobaca qinghaiensis]|nr:hypothetical protein [Sinobaca qinghaiensis]
MDQKGGMMPIAAAVCALCAGLVLLMVGSYAVHKQNAALHEQSIQLEWTLQNAEKKWYQEGKQPGEQEYVFPTGEAVVVSTITGPGTSRVMISAELEGGERRSHSFSYESVQESFESIYK